MAKLGIGLIGCGGMGMRLGGAVNTLENARITAVCDLLDEKTQAALEELGAEAKYADYHQLLADKQVDAVIVATPCNLHAPMTIDAAAAGKHIFTEKPMALSVKDCDEMIAAAKRADVKLMVGQVLRYIGHFQKIREVLSTGVLGKVCSIDMARVTNWTYDKGWRLNKEESGGMLFEVQIHELDYMAHLLGEPESVYAQTGHFVKKNLDYNDDLMAVYRFANGGIGAIHASFGMAIGRYHGKILCEKGSIVFGHADGEVLIAEFGEEPRPIDCQNVPDAKQRELAEFVAAVLNNTEPPIPGRDGRRAVGMAQGAYLSAESGSPVKLPLSE